MRDIKEILASPEGKTLEFKRDLSSIRPVLKALVAFANTAGGTLIIGREDDGEVVGVKKIEDEHERLANCVADSIVPVLLPDIDTVHLGRKKLLVVRVSRWPGPFYLKAEGPEGASTSASDPPTVGLGRKFWKS